MRACEKRACLSAGARTLARARMCSYTCVGAPRADGISDFVRAGGRGYPAAPALLGRQELRKPRVEGTSIA